MVVFTSTICLFNTMVIWIYMYSRFEFLSFFCLFVKNIRIRAMSFVNTLFNLNLFILSFLSQLTM